MAFTQARRQDGKEIGFKIVSDMVGWLLLSSSPKLLYICTYGPVELFGCYDGEISSSMAMNGSIVWFTKNNFFPNPMVT